MLPSCACFGWRIRLVTVATLFAANPGRAQESDWDAASVEDLSQQQEILERNVPFVPPREISSRVAGKNEVDATLNVDFAEVTVDRPVDSGGVVTVETDTLCVRTYDGQMVAPLIRVKAGDLLRVTLNNRLPASAAHGNVERGDPMPEMFDVTNLHTHGLHVSPKGNSDNVFIEVQPQQSQAFCFDIPANHVAGTFWFHAHCHGSTALQLTSGMAGER